jgi:hypothetical protein
MREFLVQRPKMRPGRGRQVGRFQRPLKEIGKAGLHGVLRKGSVVGAPQRGRSVEGGVRKHGGWETRERRCGEEGNKKPARSAKERTG